MLNADQQRIELLAERRAFCRMLGQFVHREQSDSLVLSPPSLPPPSDTAIRRPELDLFSLRSQQLGLDNELLTAKNRPKFNLFLQGGAGRPALNMLDNGFKGFYIGGVTMTVPLSGFYTLKRDRAIIRVNQERLDLHRETFIFNTRLAMKRQHEEEIKLESLLSSDDTIILLRNRVKETALVQLQHGVINSNDYLRDVNAVDMARQRRAMHMVQLLKTRAEQHTITGN